MRALHAKDWDQAQSICRTLIEAGQPSPDAYHLLGIALGETGQLQGAIDAFRQAVAGQPENAVYQASLALTLKRIGQLDQAAEAYVRALQRAPQHPHWNYQLGLVHAELGRAPEAEAAYGRALALKPDLIEAKAALARLHEAQGAWEKAEAMSLEVLRQDPGNAAAKITYADLLLRQNHEGGVEVLESLAYDQSVALADRAIAYGKLGKQWDREGQFDRAWQAFTTGNALLLERATHIVRSVYGREQIEILRSRLENPTWSVWPEMPEAQPETQPVAPVFLVGFPRSGTTLLERMLAAHPAVSQLDEKDTLGEALALIGGSAQSAALEQWDRRTIERLRAGYWASVDYHLGRARRESEVIVDKLPLNSLHLELIFRLFPNARILFAIRDPRDVCLSCFMQSFGLNDAMANFLTIDSTVSYYVEAMTLALALREALPLEFCDIRYEKLVDQPERELKRVLEFLDLAWSSEVLQFHDAHPGEVSNTPSYQQVRQPLYATSIGRWRRYQSHIGNAFEPLSPFVDALGYS